MVTFGVGPEQLFFTKSTEVFQYFNNQGFPGGSDGKESACNARDPGSVPGSGRSSGEGHGDPLQCSYLENGQRSLVGYSPWARKESDMTKRLSTHTYT